MTCCFQTPLVVPAPTRLAACGTLGRCCMIGSRPRYALPECGRTGSARAGSAPVEEVAAQEQLRAETSPHDGVPSWPGGVQDRPEYPSFSSWPPDPYQGVPYYSSPIVVRIRYHARGTRRNTSGRPKMFGGIIICSRARSPDCVTLSSAPGSFPDEEAVTSAGLQLQADRGGFKADHRAVGRRAVLDVESGETGEYPAAASPPAARLAGA